MLKHIYRGMILVAIFVGALFFFSQNITEEEVEVIKTIKMSNATFPILYIQSGEENVNLLHGYSSNIDTNLIRDAITPVDEDESISVLIDEKDSVVKKIDYEVCEVYDNTVIDSGSISALEKKDDKKYAKIRLKAELEVNTEYALKITAVTDSSKKIRYYTRIKLMSNNHIKDNLEFVMNFHDSIMNKKNAEDMVIYLEPDYTSENKSLAHVTINSNFELVSWSDLNPTVVSDIVPTITETNADTSSIQLRYLVSAETENGTEYYNVKEYYRVRWTASRMYLLNYDRTMESIFDMNLSDVTNKQIKIGITGEDTIPMVTSSDQNKICFVRERALWFYDLAENKAVDVFSFHIDTEDYERELYDQHDIRILNMDDDGNIDFMVYGYMNRGYYEGRVAVVLYRYYAAENRIEEQVYIPMSIPYQMLKEELDSFSYVNQADVFYFSMNETIYAYNILTQNIKEIATDINSDNLYLSREGKYVAWQDNNSPKKTKSIVILDLETGKVSNITAQDNQNIKILGTIDENIIYGYAKTKDITTNNADGSVIVPLYKVEIANKDGDILKNYYKKGTYVVNSKVKDNIIELYRVKKNTSGSKVTYDEIESDYILNKAVEEKTEIETIKINSDKRLNETYLTLPESFVATKEPKVSGTVNTVIKNETTLHLDKTETATSRYFVYALGEITESYLDAGEAILDADSKFGVVLNNKQQAIWERGEKSSKNLISNITPIYVSENVNSIGASMSMLLNYTRVNVSAAKLSSGEESIYDTLTEHMKYDVINLTGANLDEVLYYVSKGRPIIAMKDKEHAVLIIGYDEFNITVVDPSAKKTMKIGLNDGSKMFEKAGNIFISYLK